MTAFQMGPAPRNPGRLSIMVLSVLPTQTPTANWGVYPTVHASRKLFVVPVLAAAGRPSASSSGLGRPMAAQRASLSERISFIKKASCGERISLLVGSSYLYRTLPSLSSTRRMATGSSCR